MKNKYLVKDDQFIIGPVTMKEPTYGGMPASKCPDIPLLDKDYYDKKISEYNAHLASLPEIQRQDNGKWKKDQELELDKDFSLWYQSPDGGCMYSFLEIKDHEQFDLFKPAAIPLNNPTHIVISKELIQEVPKMEKPREEDFTRSGQIHSDDTWIDYEAYHKAVEGYNKHLALLPTIQRADNGKWKVGQGLRIGVDFEVKKGYIMPFSKDFHTQDSFGNNGEYPQSLDMELIEAAIPIEQQGSNPDNELIDFANSISMKAFAELAEQQEQPTPQAEEEVIKRWLTGIIRSNGSETDVFKAAKCLKELLIRKNEL